MCCCNFFTFHHHQHLFSYLDQGVFVVSIPSWCLLDVTLFIASSFITGLLAITNFLFTNFVNPFCTEWNPLRKRIDHIPPPTVGSQIWIRLFCSLLAPVLHSFFVNDGCYIPHCAKLFDCLIVIDNFASFSIA